MNSKYLEFFIFADFSSTDSDLLIKLYPEHFSFFYFFYAAGDRCYLHVLNNSF